MKLNASHCVFPTPDIQKTAEYYVEKLGFRRVDYLNAQEKHICLYRDNVEFILTVVSSIFRTFRNHLVVVPPDVACSSTFSVPRVILACTSAWHTLTSRQTVHLGTRRPSWFCA